MKFATWNVNGIRARASQVESWLAREQPDVVCLQELKAELTQVPEAVQSQDYHAFWHCCKGYSGVSLQLRKDAFPGIPVYGHPAFDFESRVVTAEVGNLLIASMYVPNGGKDYPAKLNFLTQLVDWVRGLRADGREVVLCGDVNIARAEIDVHPRERDPRKVGQLPEERAIFETLLDAGLTDVGRAVDPANAGLFTWWAPWRELQARNIGWRLDYFLASPGLSARVQSCVVQADLGTSDHAPVMMTTVELAE
ncbi:MAG: exodeoxyribonuclease III [Gemmatimonadota bacterium]